MPPINPGQEAAPILAVLVEADPTSDRIVVHVLAFECL
jgi:hypothetical protein